MSILLTISRKNEEWKQKTDKIKLEQEKLSAAAAVKKNIVPNPAFSAVGNVNSKPVIGMSKLPPKVPIQQHGPPPPTSSNYNFNFGNAPPGMNNRLLDNIGGFKASGPMKSYIKQKPGLQPSTSTGRSMPIMGHYPPPVSLFRLQNLITIIRLLSISDFFKYSHVQKFYRCPHFLMCVLPTNPILHEGCPMTCSKLLEI